MEVTVTVTYPSCWAVWSERIGVKGGLLEDGRGRRGQASVDSGDVRCVRRGRSGDI